MQPMPAAADTGIDRAIVTVTMTRDGRQYSTELGMQRLGFAHFAQFIDQWDPRVQIHDDRIDGRFHSNSEIYIDNSRGVQPVFLGEVTTARDINTSRSERSVRKSEVFLGGFETRVRRITMPKPSERFDEDFVADEGQVIRLAGDTQLHFRPDATVSLQSIGTHSTRSIAMSRNEPHYFIGTDDANISVRGIVDGQVLIYTSADIVIEGDLTYVDDPGKNPMSDDFLGLVSDRSIAIAGPEVTGSGDLIVQAALYARRQFVVKNHFNRQNATLHVYGSITAGSLSATEPRFRTKLEFDQRLAYRRPPAFPVTDRYEIVDRDGEWTVTAD
jgi:hypothetical protein